VPPLYRIREIASSLVTLKERRKDLCSASELMSDLHKRFQHGTENAWVLLMENLLQSFREETVNAELPVEHAIEYLYETLTEQRRDHSFGGGIYISTVHGAKGMEFNHVFILDDGWPGGRRKRGQPLT